MKLLILTGTFSLLISASLLQAETGDTLSLKGRFYLDSQPVSIEVADGKIVQVKHLSSRDHVPDAYISPGLIDVQINGYLGVDFSSKNLTVDDVRKSVRALWKEGVTSFFPTLTSNPDNLLKQNFGILSQAMDDPEIGHSIAGFHLEGPYISPVEGYRGDHPEKYIRKPDWHEFSGYQHAANHAIKLITIAPEVEGALQFINKCIEDGIIVSLGHHNASASVIEKAADAGAKMSTHLGNGCANEINRHANPLWPQLADDRLTPSIIADGYHLRKEEIKSFYKVKGPEHTILVSDMVDLAGMSPGEYKKGNQIFLLTPNVVKYPAENVLAGAASSLRRCVGNIMKFTGCSLKDAIQMGSGNPARMFGLSDLGEISVGKRADIITFRINQDEIEILTTMISGKVVYTKQ